MTAAFAAAATVVVARALRRPALLADSRLVCIDGPSGSGKTSLAGEVARQARADGLTVTVVHLDDVYDGWDGLPTVGGTLLEDVVRPLDERRPAAYRCYDWYAGQYAGTRSVQPAELVVLEGVGSGHPGFADLVTLLVWVEAPSDVCLRRGLARDGTEIEPLLLAWRVAEDDLHRQEGTRRRADVLVDGVTAETVDR